MVADPLVVALRVAGIFERLGIVYAVGGSVASSIHGETRATMDVDFIANLPLAHVAGFVELLGEEFYADEAQIRGAVSRRGHFNVIHLELALKVDVFLPSSALDEDELARRQAVPLPGGAGAVLWVASPEDVVLQKLAWYRRGGGTSDRQWRDVLGVLKVRGDSVDRAYLEAGSRRAGLADLLARALEDASR